jgi:hypothetical protein
MRIHHHHIPVVDDHCRVRTYELSPYGVDPVDDLFELQRRFGGLSSEPVHRKQGQQENPDDLSLSNPHESPSHSL